MILHRGLYQPPTRPLRLDITTSGDKASGHGPITSCRTGDSLDCRKQSWRKNSPDKIIHFNWAFIGCFDKSLEIYVQMLVIHGHFSNCDTISVGWSVSQDLYQLWPVSIYPLQLKHGNSKAYSKYNGFPVLLYMYVLYSSRHAHCAICRHYFYIMVAPQSKQGVVCQK